MPVVHYEAFRVRYYECDAYGHLNNVNYLRWMQEAAFGASMAVGYDFARYAELGHYRSRVSSIVPLDPSALQPLDAPADDTVGIALCQCLRPLINLRRQL